MNNSSVQIQSNCPKCNAPSITVAGQLINGCTCNITPSVPTFNQNVSPFEAARMGDDPINLIQEIVAKECEDADSTLNTFGVPVYAKAVMLLAKAGRVKVLEQKGYRIKFDWL